MMDRLIKHGQTVLAAAIVIFLAGVTFEILAGTIFWLAVLVIVAAAVAVLGFLIRYSLK